MVNPQLDQSISIDIVKNLIRELMYVGVTINQKIVRTLPKSQDREDALKYLMKCQANRTKWSNRLVKGLNKEIDEEQFKVTMKQLYRSYELRMALAENKDEEMFEFEKI